MSQACARAQGNQDALPSSPTPTAMFGVTLRTVCTS
jgi:hypothetical protein